jgi:hypothetical protein
MELKPISVEQIDYRVLSDAEAIIGFCDYSIAAAFPRNCVAFDGSR